MENTLLPKQKDMRKEGADALQPSTVVTITADSQPLPTTSRLHRKYSGLSWEEAIYKFPTENVAIMGEDGQIISANNCWLAANQGPPGDISSTPEIAINYFEFLRFVLPNKEAQRIVMHLKQLIRGEIQHVVASCTFGLKSAQGSGDIVAFKLVDSPNTLVIIHDFNRADR